ncbi:MAG: rhamnosyltransferase [Thiohalomonadaceae bacterium]
MSCAIIIVTYNPDKETLDYIRDLSSKENHIIVVDNSTRPIDFSLLEHCPALRLIRNGGNLGLATALNRGVQSALAAGINEIFLFDQDSRVPSGYIENMLLFKRDTAEKDCVIVAPNFIDTNIGTEARFSILNKWRWHNMSCSDTSSPMYVSFAITSGTLLDGTLHQKLGPFRDDYFIDHVDSEYCLRAISNGMKIKVNCAVVLQHTIGSRTMRKLLGITIKPNNHPPVRRYYILRNGVRTAIEYGWRYPSVISLNFARAMHELLAIVFFENNKRKKLAAVLVGTWHGIVNRMGPAPTSIVNS